MLRGRIERSVWAIAILAAPKRADPPVGTKIGAAADLPAGVVYAGVLQQAIAGKAAGSGIPPVPVGEVTDCAAVS